MQVRHALPGTLIGWITRDGHRVGTVKGGLENSKGNGARVRFDRPHPEMLKRHPNLAPVAMGMIDLDEHAEVLTWNVRLRADPLLATRDLIPLSTIACADGCSSPRI